MAVYAKIDQLIIWSGISALILMDLVLAVLIVRPTFLASLFCKVSRFPLYIVVSIRNQTDIVGIIQVSHESVYSPTDLTAYVPDFGEYRIKKEIEKEGVKETPLSDARANLELFAPTFTVCHCILYFDMVV